jgi:hypothetical protein
MLYYQQIYQRTNKNTYKIVYGILLVIWKISRGKYRWNEADNCFWHASSVYKSLSKFITDRPEITDESFSDGPFSFVNKTLTDRL